MEGNTKGQQKRCDCCGRYFRPEKRAGDRQKVCSDRECKAKRKKESQKKRVAANPGYFKGRYEYVRQWRKKHPDYQRRWRAKKREIQDEILKSKRLGKNIVFDVDELKAFKKQRQRI
jgi:hypothetical protein